MNCKGPNLFDAECVSLISTVSVQKSYCNVISCNTKCYIQYNDTLCRLWCWRTATALVWWHQPGALKVLSTNKGRCPKRKLCLPKTNWKEGEGGTYSTDSYFPDFVFVFVSFMINIKVTNMKSTAEKLLSTNPKSVKNRHFCMNKNTKCPIDAHCHRHCRRDPRITQDYIEVLQVLSFYVFFDFGKKFLRKLKTSCQSQKTQKLKTLDLFCTDDGNGHL